MKALITLLATISLFACATTKSAFVADGSTAETTQLSVSWMTRDFTSQQRFEFMLILLQIQFSHVKTASESKLDPELQGLNYSVIGSKIHGLTYDEILELAKQSPTKVTLEIKEAPKEKDFY